MHCPDSFARPQQRGRTIQLRPQGGSSVRGGPTRCRIGQHRFGGFGFIRLAPRRAVSSRPYKASFPGRCSRRSGKTGDGMNPVFKIGAEFARLDGVRMITGRSRDRQPAQTSQSLHSEDPDRRRFGEVWSSRAGPCFERPFGNTLDPAENIDRGTGCFAHHLRTATSSADEPVGFRLPSPPHGGLALVRDPHFRRSASQAEPTR